MSTSKILIVEDESIVALDMQARLKRLGYQVVGIASSGEEAIEMAGKELPDLALMDIRLRGDMDGVDTARHLRQSFDIPVVYLTAYADTATLERAKITEPFGYLVKPFEEREMHSTIEMALYKISNEKRSKIQAARLQKIISSVPEGVALLGGDGRLLLANTKAEEYLGILADMRTGGIVEGLGACTLQQLLSDSNGSKWHEVAPCDLHGRVFEANVSSVMSPSEKLNHDPSECVMVIREVTAEREIQKRIQLQDRLATVGQFAAGIAHDFNNILASIILAPYMIMKTEPQLSPKNRDRLDSVSQHAKRASNLIQQILDFSRASKVEMHVFDLVPLIRELAKMLERLLPENIRLEFSYESSGFTINGDPTRVLQLLMNLSLNARDAMPKGGILCVQLAHVSRQDFNPDNGQSNCDWISIMVTDTGTGIHPDALPHLFEPFFTTKEPGKGTGLGLAQVYGIVQQHRGHITVDSQLGSGTTFRVYFPLMSQRPSSTTNLHLSESDSKWGNNQTLLIVEDDPDVIQSVRELLELSGYHVLTATNGREALVLLEQSGVKVDLILSDLIMPEMGGIELCRNLREKESDVKIMVLTSYVTDDNLTELQSLGIVDCLNKPIDVQHLLRNVELALSSP